MKRRITYFILFILFGISLFSIIKFHQTQNKETSANPNLNLPSLIEIEVEGEVARDCTLVFAKQITYGFVFLQIKSILNPYSDLSSFDPLKVIEGSIYILIPTLDLHNEYIEESVSQLNININTATKKELLQLKQIGEKRAQKILDFIEKYGKITSWDLFWRITDVPEKARDYIRQQAFL